MNYRDELYLHHIRESIERIEKYTVDGRAAFFESSMVQDSVVRNLQTLAESTKRLSPDGKEMHPEIDWPKIVGFRNKLVHDYVHIDLDLTWEVIERDLPPLKQAILHLISILPPEL